MTRKRSKNTKKYYFTKVHEDAIVEYASTADHKRRTELYIDLIQPAFDEMVDKIVYTYKFTVLPNIDELRDECKIHLITLLDKFDPDKGSRAFSYFSVVTKNWFIQQVKKNTRRRNTEVQYDEIPKVLEQEKLTEHNPYMKEREKDEFWEAFWVELDEWKYDLDKPNERIVYDAIVTLMKNADDLELFSKKACYLYLREISKLETKQIVAVLSKFRKEYRDFKRDWNNGRF